MSAGYLGILDWTGLPFGATVGSIVPVGGHGFRGAGKYLSYVLYLANQQRNRRRFQELATQQMEYTKNVLEQGWEAERQYRKNLTQKQLYTILLAEI